MKPRTITSIEGLDSLPLNATVLDLSGGFVVVWQKTLLDKWVTVGDPTVYNASQVFEESDGSLIVVYM